MEYQDYLYIFYGGAVMAGIMLIVSVLLFIFLKIPTVIGDLNGSNARKAIADIRSQNENSGTKVYKTSHVNRERGKLTDKISPSGNLIKNPGDDSTSAMATEKISTWKLSHKQSDETVVLDMADGKNVQDTGGRETTVLGTGGEDTMVLCTGSEETTVLSTDSEETTVLNRQQEAQPVFHVEYEITFIHTNEVII